MRRFVVTAERTPRGWWVLEAPEVGAVSQVRRLDRAAEEMSEAVAWLAGVPESEIAIDVRPVLPEEFVEARAVAREWRTEAERLQDKATEANRKAIDVLSGQGYSVRDIGVLMGISAQRVSQLAQ